MTRWSLFASQQHRNKTGHDRVLCFLIQELLSSDAHFEAPLLYQHDLQYVSEYKTARGGADTMTQAEYDAAGR